MEPILSICIPSYNRPQWLERALKSITSQSSTLSLQEVEIIITDDSSTNICEAISRDILKHWSGKSNYYRNTNRLGMVGNWNQGIQLASGQYVLVLHDDDFLLPQSIQKIIETLQSVGCDYRALLFGVTVVNSKGKLIRKQVPRRTAWLNPTLAVEKLLGNSSFIRFPGMVCDRSLLQSLGGFKANYGGTADVAMWLQVLSQEGLLCVRQMTSAYTVHTGALTMKMFNFETIQQLDNIFLEAQSINLIPEDKLAQLKSDFYHQFILAGTFRFLRRGKISEAKEVLSLFQTDDVSQLPSSPKWSIIKSGLINIMSTFNFI
jgi:glycosyltransferase involved in cell wall biosynthesis